MPNGFSPRFIAEMERGFFCTLSTEISELNLHTSLYDVYMPAVEHIVDVAVAYGGVAVAQTCYHIFIYLSFASSTC